MGRLTADPAAPGGERLLLSDLGRQFAAVIRALTGGPRWGFDEGLAQHWRTGFELGAVFWPLAAGMGVDPRGGMVVPHDSAIAAFDTRDVTYTAVTGGDPALAIDMDALNREVLRFAAAPADRANPALGPATGSLGVPLLALKGTGDLFTPIMLDRRYTTRVRAAGDAEKLVTRAVRHSGHCNFPLGEVLEMFLDGLDWVDGGERPAGEDLGADLSGAGVAFTNPFDPGDPLAPGS